MAAGFFNKIGKAFGWLGGKIKDGFNWLVNGGGKKAIDTAQQAIDRGREGMQQIQELTDQATHMIHDGRQAAHDMYEQARMSGQQFKQALTGGN